MFAGWRKIHPFQRGFGASKQHVSEQGLTAEK
jgi:hypothetical protein